MAVLRSMLLPLGLCLCLRLLFSSANPVADIDNCMPFDKVITTTGSAIRVDSDVYKSNKIYTVWVPVNNSISSVVLRAVDNNNNSIGNWQKADKYCNSSAIYNLKDSHNMIFVANWISPNSRNITTVELQAFTINFDNVATFSFLKLKKNEMTTSLTPTTSTSKPSTTSRPSMTSMASKTSMASMTSMASKTSTASKTSSTRPTTTPHRTTPRSLANRVFLSPITDAIHILLIFLTSKLLF
ncbi:placenta-expressed transcript 1 protein [Equus przewalskii]|uniref:Placenta-expressed transcript 1 protein n=1 Tax=Equus przewalskii TaxID=9798 RepID=A0ABM2F8W5_EQUPR